MNRRTFLKKGSQAGIVIAGAPLLNIRRFRLFASSAMEYSARSIDLVHRSNVIDMLNVFNLGMVLSSLTGDKKPTWLENPELIPAAESTAVWQHPRHALAPFANAFMGRRSFPPSR